MAGHADGQLPFAVIGRRANVSDEAIARCQEWIALNYSDPNPVQRMTAHSGLNARTFARRFRAATGKNPLDYVHALRIEEAKQMLETDSTPVNEISAAVGYEDPAAFRRLFGKLVGITPAAYRKKFALHALA
jgi:transcriptional regulator GlxA family with amidase domain